MGIQHALGSKVYELRPVGKRDETIVRFRGTEGARQKLRSPRIRAGIADFRARSLTGLQRVVILASLAALYFGVWR